MKHLVLGSSGQIGTHLVNYLQDANEEVIEFDLVRTDKEDLRVYDNELLKQHTDACDIVHFLAGDVGGAAYMHIYQDTHQFISNNIKIMNTVFDVLKDTKKPFLFTTSQMSNMTYSTYGTLKAIGEAYTRALNGVAMKFWNVYGYESDRNRSHVITDFINSAKNEGKIVMRTDGREVRQFLYSDDCAECILKLAEMHDKIDRTKALNVTTFEWISVLEIAHIISAEFDNCPIEPAARSDDIQKDKRNEPDEYILQFWKPRTNIKSGVKKIIEMMK